MQLRNRKVPLRTRRARPRKAFLAPFQSFSRLPTEIRHMIWRLSLQPRIVEIESIIAGRYFHARTRLPSALVVCQDSRAAVIASYPLCFHSRSMAPKIRFNFSLDTLLIGSHFEERLFHLLDILTDQELSSIRHIAFEESLGGNRYLFDVQGSLWEHLGSLMDSFTALEEIIVVRNVRIQVASVFEEWIHDVGYCYQFFDHFPPEMLRRELSVTPSFGSWLSHAEQWKNPKVKKMWGWRRDNYPRYI